MRTVALLAVTTAIAVGLAGSARAQSELPDGKGKAVVQMVCTECHEADVIVNAGGTRDEWAMAVQQMIDMGAMIQPEEISVITDYLTEHFPPKTKPLATTISGTVHASFREWALPTRAFPHDPYAAPDGSIWYTGQLGNVIGRVDPTSGKIKEYKIKTPGSGPHGLVGDADGNIWFTANFRGYIGKLDPKTGAITEYRLPEGHDPHTPVFDHQGILWFTVQGGNLIGRLDPKTGAMKMTQVPTRGALPYGMVVNSKGVPFFAEFGSNKLGSIDPKTLQIKEYTLPHRDAQPRRIAITSNDVLWYGDYARGYLGSYDPKTGKAREWKSPGGEDAEPYGITALNDVIWYSESGVSPNTLVRFDPKTQQFQTWKIPSGGGTVRNMMPTKDGGLALAESGENKIALVTLN
jgi:virginiamycin B lyase